MPYSVVLTDATILFHDTGHGVVLKCRLFDLGIRLKLIGIRDGRPLTRPSSLRWGKQLVLYA